jgi:hypothetical protein
MDRQNASDDLRLTQPDRTMTEVLLSDIDGRKRRRNTGKMFAQTHDELYDGLEMLSRTVRVLTGRVCQLEKKINTPPC